MQAKNRILKLRFLEKQKKHPEFAERLGVKIKLINHIKENDKMLVLGINKILGWCQIVSGGRRYTCPTKEIDGDLCFAFKRSWHPVA